MNLNRVGAGLVALVLLTLLAIAWKLDPNPRGMGTHRQLGLPPCSMVVMFGSRCPACGMTTSWAHFMDGNWTKSLEANLAGFLLAIVSVATIAGAIATLRSGRLPSNAWQWRLLWALVVVMVVALAQWGVRLGNGV